jgi:hypothetical protein
MANVSRIVEGIIESIAEDADATLSRAFNCDVRAYNGSRNPNLERDSAYPQTGVLFLSDNEEVAKNYGSNVYQCEVDLGNNAELTTESSPLFKLPILKQAQKSILLGELWHDKPLEREIVKVLFSKGYDSITLFDTSSEEYDDGDPNDFAVTYIVKNANSQVRVIR